MNKTDWTGILNLDIEDRNGKSVATDVFFHDSFKVQRPVYHGNTGIPCYYILNVGGGYVDGDTYRLEVRLKEGAKLTLTTLAATTIYKTPDQPAYQESDFHLGNDSYLEYLPEPLIGYKNSSYKQLDNIYMEEGATLLYSDIVTPGWSPEGKPFSYDMLQLKTNIYMEDELVVYDNLKLQPDVQKIDGLGFMEGYSHIGTFIVVSEQTDDGLIERLYETIQSQSGDFKAGISKLSVPGFSVRILGNMTQDIKRVIFACREQINEEWFGVTPGSLRKY